MQRNVCMCICVYVSMCICVYVDVWMCVCVYIRGCITYIYIYVDNVCVQCTYLCVNEQNPKQSQFGPRPGPGTAESP